MEVEILALVYMVKNKKLPWIYALHETEKKPRNALGKTAKLNEFDVWLLPRKRGLGTCTFARKANGFIERLIFRLVLGNLR